MSPFYVAFLSGLLYATFLCGFLGGYFCHLFSRHCLPIFVTFLSIFYITFSSLFHHFYHLFICFFITFLSPFYVDIIMRPFTTLIAIPLSRSPYIHHIGCARTSQQRSDDYMKLAAINIVELMH